MKDYVQYALSTLRVQQSPLLLQFFSPRNIDKIQKSIIRKVKSTSGHQIDRQSDDELYVVMQYIYTTYLKNNHSVDTLNQYTIHEITPMIVSNVQSHFYYLNDISSQPIPMRHAAATSIKGENSLINQEF